jgi:hypothetical protein
VAVAAGGAAAVTGGFSAGAGGKRSSAVASIRVDAVAASGFGGAKVAIDGDGGEVAG